MHRLAVHRDRFECAVSGLQDRDAGRLVNAARLHADKAVLDQIDAADAVFAAEVVELRQQAAGESFLPSIETGRPFRIRSLLFGLSGASSGELVR